MIARTSSSRISAAVPGSVPSPASLRPARNVSIGRSSVAAPCVTSSGEKAWMCMPGTACLDGAADRFVGLAGVVGMDAALQADLGGAALPRLDGAPRHLLQREIVGLAAQVVVRAALGEGAEAAAEVADVGVVDVAVDDVADDVAAHRLAQRVGRAGDMAIVGVARREQPLDLGMVEPLAAGRAIDDAHDLGIDLAEQHLRRAAAARCCRAPSRPRAPSPRHRSCGAPASPPRAPARARARARRTDRRRGD